MDILAKKMPPTAMDGLVRGHERDATVLPPPDKDGVRIAELDEMSYRRELWTHTPLTDFWRLGKGYAKKFQSHGLKTMGDIARYSIRGPQDFYNEDLLYKLFGVNAEQEERKEKSLQHAMIAIKHRFGKNAILKGSNLQEGAMTIERNQQRGGHHE